MAEPRTRRDFLRLAGAGALAVAAGTGCSSGSDGPEEETSKPNGKSSTKRTLRIVQWSHFVPAYDAWFDDEYTKRWGEEHDCEVVVDHVTFADIPTRADGEVAAGRGHDIFGFVSPPTSYEDHVIDHREIVEEVTAKIGPMTPLVERSILNPKTQKYFAFSDYWSPRPVHYRADLWNTISPGLVPGTWDGVLRAGPALKAAGHPLGLGLSADPDSEWGLTALLNAYGAGVQDEQSNVVINRPATVEAVKMGAALYQAGMTDEVFAWDAASNNRSLAAGKASLILNPISAVRTIEGQDPSLATQIALAPPPAGPAGRSSSPIMGVYVIWKFARQQALAKQFLADLALGYGEAFRRSDFYNLPSFPGAVPDLAAALAGDTGATPGRYDLLADAAQWTTNTGHPGFTSAPVDEVFNQFIVSKMFAAVARGETSAEDAVAAAEAQIKPIFEKWREQGKI